MTFVPTQLLIDCQTYARQYTPVSWQHLSEYELWENLVLRILSTQTRWEHAIVVADRLRDRGLLAALQAGTCSRQRVLRALRAKPGVRWPRRKAIELWEASQILYVHGQGLQQVLASSHDCKSLRRRLAETIPGIGMKQASHFLQTVGFGNELAVLDRHILRFLNQVGNVSARGSYEGKESAFHALASELGVLPAVLDFAIWNHMRS